MTATDASAVPATIDDYFAANDRRFREWLTRLVATPSVAPQEGPAQTAVRRIAIDAGLEATLAHTPLALATDPRFIPTGHSFEDRPNLLVTSPGTPAAPIVLNAHIDVVEDGIGWTRSPNGTWEGDRFYGRGACDAKGSTVAALMAMTSIADLGLPAAPLELHSVIDEEPGGNGTLAVVRRRQQDGQLPQLAIVMEPSDLDVFLGHRGMLWYRIVCSGRQGHGSTGDGVNAIVDAANVVAALDRFAAELAATTRAGSTAPTVNVGTIEGGTESYTTAARCVIELTARYAVGERDLVDGGIRAAVAGAAVSGDVAIEFTRDFDAAATPADDATVDHVLAIVRDRIPTSSAAVMLATCDLRHYRNVLDIPAVVFGPGSLAHAHGPDEFVDWPDVVLAAKAIVDVAVSRAHHPTPLDDTEDSP